MTTIPMPRKGKEPNRLVSANDLAERWGVHRDSVYRIPATQLPFMKLGPRTRRYRWADVLEFEQTRTVG